MFKTSRLFTAVFAALAFPMAVPAFATAEPKPAAGSAAAAPAAPATIELRFIGIATPTGAVMASIFDSEAGYDSGKPVRGVRIPVNGAEASQLLEGLPPGTYAVKSFHDVNGDGQMALNPFGTPLEPFAFSNDAPANMGPPAWAAAKFDVAAGSTVHTITIK
jgi:uncharacterized protein (DUF2141 family)